jgi:hypothetical protein
MFPVEAFQNTLLKAVNIFRQLGAPFHITGGMTSVLYGEPRMTQDIDIVVDNQILAERIDTLIECLNDSGFLFDAASVRKALDQKDMFQLFDMVEALKLDIYPREMIPGELSRSCFVEIFPGVELPVVARVDAAASKLVWVSKGSHKSRRDLRQIFRNASLSDREQIYELAQKLSLRTLLDEVLNESDEIR